MGPQVLMMCQGCRKFLLLSMDEWIYFLLYIYIGPQVGLDDVAYTSMEKGKSLGLENFSQFYVGVTEFD